MFLVLSLLACVKAPGAATASMAPSSNVWLRNSFDTDASSYVGRFVPAGATELDEARAMPLACSRFVTSRFVDGGGVRYAEMFQVSAEASARIGLPVVGSAEAAGGGARTARVEYTLTGKLVSEVADPVAFAECCKTSPDQCSDRYIGEFLQGTGAVLHEARSGGSGALSATSPASGAAGDVAVSASSQWTRAVEFPNPVYFAFKVTQTPYTQQAVSTCPAWVTAPPSTTDGVMVVGQSREVKSEAAARSGAMANAQTQIWQTTGGSAADGADAGGGALTAKEWCVQPKPAGGETRYVGYVLVHVPQAAVDAMRAAARQRAAAVEGAVANPGVVPPGPAVRPSTPPVGVTATPPAPPVAAPSPVVPAAPGGPPMSEADVDRVVAAMQQTAFATDQVGALRMGTAGRALTVAQARRLVEVLAFPADRIVALTQLRPAITDPQNAVALLDLFTFSSDKSKVEALFR